MTRLGPARKTPAAVALALLAVPAVGAPVTADATPEAAPRVIGDSISWYAADEIHALAPDWTIDARRGRPVSLLDDRVERIEGEPSPVVMELGTNIDADWTKADFARVVDLLPATTQKFFVRPRVFHAGKRRVVRVKQYGNWMVRIARARPDVHIIDWRSRVEAHRRLLRRDGVHPTARGQRVLARMIVRSVGAVLGSG